MAQERLTDLAILAIESDISDRMDMEDIIDDFSMRKTRKVIL